ncbi:MAG: hypothetical protein GY810_04310 [Aureispira sp.]|nr:hypothetical protein [Aureispira sp.]
MEVFENEITIDKPVQEVWDFFSTRGNLHKWLQGFQSVRVTKGEFGQPGARAEHTYRALGRSIVMNERVLVSEPCKRFESFVSNPAIDTGVKTMFEDLGEKTKVKCYVEVDIKSRPLKLIKKLIVKYSAERSKNDWKKLKSIVERKQKS